MMKPRQQLTVGIKAGLPIAAGYFPIAIAFGALASQAGLAWYESVLMSLIVFAGASQFVGVTMLLAGAGAAQIIAATFFLNLRHLVMSLAVNDRMRSFSPAWKKLLSFFITDETFALLTLGEGGTSQALPGPHYLTGLMVTAYLGWVSGTAAGGLGAGFIPAGITSAMTLGLYGLFIGLLVPPIRQNPGFGLVAGTSIGLNWALNDVLGSGWSIVIAAVVGAAVGIPLAGGDE